MWSAAYYAAPDGQVALIEANTFGHAEYQRTHPDHQGPFAFAAHAERVMSGPASR